MADALRTIGTLLNVKVIEAGFAFAFAFAFVLLSLLLVIISFSAYLSLLIPFYVVTTISSGLYGFILWPVESSMIIDS